MINYELIDNIDNIANSLIIAYVISSIALQIFSEYNIYSFKKKPLNLIKRLISCSVCLSFWTGIIMTGDLITAFLCYIIMYGIESVINKIKM